MNIRKCFAIHNALCHPKLCSLPTFDPFVRVGVEQAREIDQVSERVRAAVESKDASIALLKEELAKQQEQASFLLDIS